MTPVLVTTAEQITEAGSGHAEGPVWSGSVLHWVDLLAGDLLTLDCGRVSRRHVGGILAALRPRASGGLVVALEREFALISPDGTVSPLGPLWEDISIRFNDGGCDPDGRFYCGSMAYDAGRGRGRLYRLDPGGEVSVVLSGVTISNGLAWSPDGSTAYYVDTPTARVDAFDYGPEGLTGRRPLIDTSGLEGEPDGLTVDAEGCLWLALHGGGAVHRFRPDGRPDGRVEVGASGVTACTFGGPALDRLYITTSRLGQTDPEPGAGALFAANVGVCGLPAATFAG